MLGDVRSVGIICDTDEGLATVDPFLLSLVYLFEGTLIPAACSESRYPLPCEFPDE